MLSFVLVGGLLTAVAGLAPGANASPSNSPANVVYTASTTPLQDLGPVNLTAVSAPAATASPAFVLHAVAPDKVSLPNRPGAGIGAPLTASPGNPFAIQSSHQQGVTGFPGISGPQQATVNFGGDLEPPDQGSCAGPDGHGKTIIGEIINNALSFYTPSGTRVLPVTATFSLFLQPSTAFLSDPRCYYDSSTHRWFFTEFNGGYPSTQFIAVSKTSDPLGNYEVFGIDTTDQSNTGGACPCFGDFDQIGADANGFYITTNEFSNVVANFTDGTVMYAISKWRLAWAADGFASPIVQRYQITGDAFDNGPGNQPYHISPASTPPGGGYAWDTEYFVESNSNQASDSHLIVYALTDTHKLLFGGTPTLVGTEITSEGYGYPGAAPQAPGTLTLGPVATGLPPIPGLPYFNTTTPQGLQTDFPAVQQVTYTDGKLYGELDTTAGLPYFAPDMAAWFILSPKANDSGVSAQISNQGYVSSSQNLMYPDIVVNGEGNGYMVFSLSGSAEYPSAAYVAFDGRSGPEGSINIAGAGAANEDSFTCYLFDYGGCRWGDYSAGAVWNGTAYMMAEYVPSSTRDLFTNWGTFIFSAPTH
ncbi:MAG: hypothetical protein ACHQFZ_11080 [Acidimicrobiales bacterium]